MFGPQTEACSAVAQEVHWSGPARLEVLLVGTVPALHARHIRIPGGTRGDQSKMKPSRLMLGWGPHGRVWQSKLIAAHGQRMPAIRSYKATRAQIM